MPFDPADPVLAPEALLANRDAFIVLDARPAEAFAAGHATGAHRLPIEAWEQAAKTEEGRLTNLDQWSRAIGALGVDGSRPAAVLDDGRMTEAARAWFILQHFGVPSAVLDGGWPVLEPLLRAAGQVETGASTEGAALRFTPRPGSGRVTLVEREPLRAEFATGAAPQIFDTRTAAEHAGLDLRKNKRGGHLPGAANLPHADLLGPNNRMLPADVLRKKLAAAGIRPGERVVTHCDGGGRASLAALAALRARHAAVGTYYLSFSDWAADESCPLER
jgi:thiosulfate/3-mercaptopyruvate sulfurtransferase